MRDLLEQLVGEMVDKGIRYEDAQREFEKHFIARVVQKATAIWAGGRHPRRAPQHADAEDPGAEESGRAEARQACGRPGLGGLRGADSVLGRPGPPSPTSPVG